jgi:hypothetical protein
MTFPAVPRTQTEPSPVVMSKPGPSAPVGMLVAAPDRGSMRVTHAEDQGNERRAVLTDAHGRPAGAFRPIRPG